MKRGIITMQSFTRAMQAQRVLSALGIQVQVLRLSDDFRAKGCGFGIEVPMSQVQRAAGALRREGIEYRAIRDKESML